MFYFSCHSSVRNYVLINNPGVFGAMQTAAATDTERSGDKRTLETVDTSTELSSTNALCIAQQIFHGATFNYLRRRYSWLLCGFSVYTLPRPLITHDVL